MVCLQLILEAVCPLEWTCPDNHLWRLSISWNCRDKLYFGDYPSIQLELSRQIDSGD